MVINYLLSVEAYNIRSGEVVLNYR